MKRTPDRIDEGRRQVRQIAQGLVLHLAAFTISAAQQVRLVDLAFIATLRRGYMN